MDWFVVFAQLAYIGGFVMSGLFVIMFLVKFIEVIVGLINDLINKI